ncbi:MAG: hypothetical protein AB1716_07830 [Planctomycetota bacterium]
MFRKVILATTVCLAVLGFGTFGLAGDNPKLGAANESSTVDQRSQVHGTPAGAGPDSWEPTLLPLFPRNYGKTVAEWSAEWWQWAVSAPPAINPVLDPNGEDAAVGQHGPVWFLAGTFGRPFPFAPVVRTCTVPMGKALFFPVMNALWWGPDDNTNPWTDNYFTLVKELRDLAVESVGPATLIRLECQIDNLELDIEDLKQRQAEAPAFAIDPARNLLPGGPRDLAAATGYWIFLEPLKPGWHTIRFYAEINSPHFGHVGHDVTYHLFVSPSSGVDSQESPEAEGT